MAGSVLVLTPTYTLDGGFVFNATDAYGVDWVVGEEQGWSDAAPVRLAVADREDAHGGVSGPVWRNARLINLKGIALCPDRVTMLTAKDRLRALGADGPDGGYSTLSVAEAHLTRSCAVKQATETRIRDVNSRAFEWEVSLRADDPLRYGDPQTLSMALPANPGGGWTWPMTWPMTLGVGLVGGGGTALNAGNADTYPTFAISGPLSNPAMYNATTDRTLSLTLDVATGDQLIVDAGNRLIALAGVSRYDALAAGSSWWPLTPGPNDVRFSASTYDTAPLLTLTWRSAWR